MIILYTTERDYPWGTLRSTHASKTKVVLEEKRLPYRIENLPPGNLWKKPPEMTARHPLGKVPYIEEDGLSLYDSTVIDEYLEDRYSWPRLMPQAPVARAKARMIEQFADEAILARDLPYLEKLLGEARAGDYACGSFSMADVPLMVLAMVLEVDQLALDKFPRVERYLRELRLRPSYRAISPRTKI